MRAEFHQGITKVRNEIFEMGNLVFEALKFALRALENLDIDLAERVKAEDKIINDLRTKIEEECFTIIATQQPAASDLRTVTAIMHMGVDLERMGDQAKGIAKVIPFLVPDPEVRVPELKTLGAIVGDMLVDAMKAYAEDDVDLAYKIIETDEEADKIYATIFTQIMSQMVDAQDTAAAEASYKVLRAARELERFGDLTTNIAEQVIFKVTGHFSGDLNN